MASDDCERGACQKRCSFDIVRSARARESKGFLIWFDVQEEEQTLDMKTLPGKALVAYEGSKKEIEALEAGEQVLVFSREHITHMHQRRTQW